jgi:hypothetical protein
MSAPTIKDILELSHELQMDLRAANSKLTTIRSWLAAQPQTVQFKWTCPQCGAGKDTERALAFHLANVHDGPPVPMTTDEAAA